MQEALEEFFNAPETLIPFCILGVLGCVFMIVYVIRNMRL